MGVLRLLSVLLLISLVLSCNDNNTGLNYGSIAGRISSSETSAYLQNAEVITIPASSVYVTSSTGVYEMENLLPGNYTLQVSRNGYKTKKVTVNVISGKRTIADILLEKGGGLSNPDDTTDPGDNDNLNVNLITHYKFDGNTLSANNSFLNLESYGISYITDRNSNVGKAAKFNGTFNSFAFTKVNNFFNVGEFTYTWWIKPDNEYGFDYFDYIDVISRWGNWGKEKQSFTFCLSKQGILKGMVYNLIDQTNNGSPDNYTFFQTESTILPNVWTHIAISYSNFQLKVYINGELVDTFYSIEPQKSLLYGLCIGKRDNDDQASYFKGAIDDLKIYKKELNSENIKSVYNGQD